MSKVKMPGVKRWHDPSIDFELFWTERTIMSQGTRQAAGRQVRAEEGK